MSTFAFRPLDAETRAAACSKHSIPQSSYNHLIHCKKITGYRGVLIGDRENASALCDTNPFHTKPRSQRVTEIRGPYYSVMGPRYLQDLLDTMGSHVDGLNTGGRLAHIFAGRGGDVESAVDKYLAKCKDFGFDVVAISTGFLSLPPDDWLRLADRVHEAGLEAKPELGIQFAPDGDNEAANLESIGTSDPSKLRNMGRRFIDAGVERMMIESDGITENFKTWRTDVIQTIRKELPMDKVMCEAADPSAFNWYIRELGIDFNPFVNHPQVMQLVGLRVGIWGKLDPFGRIVTHRRGE